MPVFALTIFTGAFLLFLVQPLIARFILPWFGGSPAVWTTCMLFFQVLLLGGYAYAHGITSRLQPRRQVVVHLLLLAVALVLLPITPAGDWKPVDAAFPALRILLLLAACLGLPYLVLAATGPLLQAWFSLARPGASPYRLYALSNFGSLLALLSYPFVVEPNLSRQAQAAGWSAGLGVFAVLCAGCGVLVWRRTRNPGTALPEASIPATAEKSVPARKVWLWFALPACGVLLLLAVTNKICQDIAVVPFLWVLPLSLYLLSFMISFDSPRWYYRPVWLPLLAVSLGTMIYMLEGRWDPEMPTEIAVHIGALFICCMVCHGELYRLRPAPRKLTGFYLSIAAGGAAGGLFVALVAPVIFRAYHEFQLGFALMAWLTVAVLLVDTSRGSVRVRPVFGWSLVGLAAVAAVAASVFLYRDARQDIRNAVECTRNFYGVLKVLERPDADPEYTVVTLQHGNITHGIQYLAPDKRQLPASYYGADSGVGLLLEHFRRPGGRRVAVIGLGTGTMAAWGRAGDYFRFYEINDEVVRIARSHFYYLRETPAQVDVVLGDARLSLEREADQRFDIIVLDAFSSDAVPVHLLTCEAFAMYRRHLRPDGVIAVHISNTYLDLEPIVMRAVDHFHLGAAIIRHDGSDYTDDENSWDDAYESDWVLVSDNRDFLERPEISHAATAPAAIPPKVQRWTDEESNLWRILLVATNSLLARVQQL